MSTALPLGLGVVGAGRFATFLSDAVADLPEVEIRAITDPDREAATGLAKRYDGWVCESWQELVIDPDVDVGAIATPPASHAEITRRALDTAPHVFSAQPVARSTADLTRLVPAAADGDCVVVVDHVLR